MRNSQQYKIEKTYHEDPRLALRVPDRLRDLPNRLCFLDQDATRRRVLPGEGRNRGIAEPRRESAGVLRPRPRQRFLLHISFI
jgi:hypothetical protein